MAWPWNAGDQLNAADLNARSHFGGTGADGALSITSGTTTLSAGSAAILVKNYTSISITGTGKLAFSNPNANGTLIILRSQGNVTLTSSTAPMIDASAFGADGGASVTGTNNGNTGNSGLVGIFATNGGVGGQVASGGPGGAVPTAISGSLSAIFTDPAAYHHWPHVWVGAGGGSGNAATNTGSTQTSGKGGRGGGALVIECAGDLNFTTASGISVAGANGSNGVVNTGNGDAGGGGGGAGGSVIILYNTATSTAGTITVTGGSGGASGVTNHSNSSGGGGGGNPVGAGNSGTSLSTGAGGLAGSGANGTSLVAKNTSVS